MRIRESSNWKDHYNNGREFYNNQDYMNALSSYQSALFSTHPSPPESEKPILLSNSVACRLKLGTPAQFDAALQEALQCVSMNPRWSKGHVRLASVYICLNRSNDACNSLQRAISLDPSNQNARSMLMKELRREKHANTNNIDDNINQNSHSNNDDRPQDPYVNASAPPRPETTSSFSSSFANPYGSNGGNNASTQYSSSYSTSRPNNISNANTTNTSSHSNNHNNNNNNNNTHAYTDIDDLPSLWERSTQKIKHLFQRLVQMYVQSNDDTKSFLKALLVILCLYIGFGGRFGLDSLFSRGGGGGGGRSNAHSYGSYSGSGSSSGGQSNRQTSSSYPYDSYHNSGSNGRYGHSSYGYGGGDNYNYGAYSSHSHHNARASSTSYHFPNLLDGSMYSMIFIFGIVYIIKQFGGVQINPWHALWMMRMMAGRGGGARPRPMGMGGMGGMGRPFGRRRF